MSFDFTQEVILEKKNYKIYRILQSILYAGSFIFGCYLIFLLLFPSGYFNFSFVNFHSNKNTLSDPRNSKGILLEKGELPKDEAMLFDASLIGNYSKAIITFDLNKKSQPLGDGKIEIRKSYRAFFLPEGEPMGFQDGLSFKIGDDYYMLSEGKLKKFISSDAYLSRFNASQAIVKNMDFLNSSAISEDMLGYADGSLIAYGPSAYIVSGKEILPIGDPTIFVGSGFSWDDLINVSGDEVAFYQKGAIFALDSPHPDGTIFHSKESGNYYIIKNGQKHSLSSDKAAASWNKRTPIAISEKSLDISDNCRLQKKAFDLGVATYRCEIDIENLADLIGKDYELSFVPANEVRLDKINVRFKKTVNRDSFRQSIFNLIGKIKGNYVKQ